jgi:hypothetical protein
MQSDSSVSREPVTVTRETRVLGLLLTGCLSVALMTAAWWMSVEGQGGPTGDSMLPLGYGAVAVFALQMLGWSHLGAFARGQGSSVRVGLAIASTLIAFGLGNFLGLFMPVRGGLTEREAVLWGLSMCMAKLGAPAIVLGAGLFGICTLWMRYH